MHSDSRDDVTYEVSIRDVWLRKQDKVVRAWRCSCPGWMVHHIAKPGYECKHIKRIKATDWCGWKQSTHGGNAVAQSQEGNDTTDFLCPNCGNFAYPEELMKTPE